MKTNEIEIKIMDGICYNLEDFVIRIHRIKPSIFEELKATGHFKYYNVGITEWLTNASMTLFKEH